MQDDRQYGMPEETKEEVVERLLKLDPIEYGKERKPAADYLGCRLSDIDAAVESARKTQQRQTEKTDETRGPEELAETAWELIDSDDVLADFAQDFSRYIAGELKLAKLLYLAGTSRLFPKPMHVAVKGPSAAGKSEIRRAVLAFFPPESVISFTALSERALIYDERDYQHKVLSMGEAAGNDEQSLQDYLLCELLSEGHLRYPTVQPIGGELRSIVIEKDGPVAFMVTTTRNKLHPENETRMLSIEVDDSEEQTRAVFRKVAEVEGLNAAVGGIGLDRWHDFQRWLEARDRAVVVPYAERLASLIPPRAVRLRRDLSQVFRAIKAHALIHREHRERDERGQIVADLEHDYATVRDLLHDLLQDTAEVKPRPSIVETAGAVKEATTDMGAHEGATARAVGRLLKLDRSTALRRLRAAEDAAYVVNLETTKGRPGQYRATGQTVDVVEMLPPVEALAPGGSVQPLQPCNTMPYVTEREEEIGCKTECNRTATGERLQGGCNDELQPIHGRIPPKNGSGCTVAAVARGGAGREDINYTPSEEDLHVEHEERLAIQNEPSLSPETIEANRILTDDPLGPFDQTTRFKGKAKP